MAVLGGNTFGGGCSLCIMNMNREYVFIVASGTERGQILYMASRILGCMNGRGGDVILLSRGYTYQWITH